jgi:hypothetical protein
MRVEFQPVVLVAAVAGFALGHYRPVVAKTSGGSGSGADTKKQMSCEEAVGQAKAAIAVSVLLRAVGENVLSGVCLGYAAGVLAASCGSS